MLAKERTYRGGMSDEQKAGKPTFTERIEVAGEQLVSTIKGLFEDAGAKRVTIRNDEGKELLRIPLTHGVAGGALAFMVAPVLSTVAVIGGTIAKLTLEIERES